MTRRLRQFWLRISEHSFGAFVAGAGLAVAGWALSWAADPPVRRSDFNQIEKRVEALELASRTGKSTP